MSSPFSIVSLIFIGLDNLLVIFVFVVDVIRDSCGNVGFHMNILLNVCDWLHGHGVNLGCSKTTELF